MTSEVLIFNSVWIATTQYSLLRFILSPSVRMNFTRDEPMKHLRSLGLDSKSRFSILTAGQKKSHKQFTRSHMKISFTTFCPFLSS